MDDPVSALRRNIFLLFVLLVTRWNDPLENTEGSHTVLLKATAKSWPMLQTDESNTTLANSNFTTSHYTLLRMIK